MRCNHNSEFTARQWLIVLYPRAYPATTNRRNDEQREDFAKTIYIRGEVRSVIKAIFHNLQHATHHNGQIDLLATLLQK